MNQPRRQRPQGSRNRNQRQRPKGPQASDLWRPVPQLPEPEPIQPVGDPTALLRSLGDAPLQGQGAVAEHYLGHVIERAANLAAALAASAGLLGQPTDD